VELSFQKYKTKLKELNLPRYSFKIAGEPGRETIFDQIRRKYVRLTPEEWVRQHFVQYLVKEGKYPPGLIGIEVPFKLNKLTRRIDILVHDRSGKPVMIVECKEPETELSQVVFDQIINYNMQFRLPFLVVTNGIINYACQMDYVNNRPLPLEVIPDYEELLNYR
jgi:hypothetical protein